MLERRRERKLAEELAAKRAEGDAALAAARMVLDYARLEVNEKNIEGVVLKRGEVGHFIIQGAGLSEPKRLPGQWTGSSKGVSFRIAKGVRYHVGGTRGTFQQGEEVMQPTDFGTFVVTNQRCIFVGSKRSIEWAYSKLLGFSLEGIAGTAIFNVSNRQKASGVLYGTEHESKIEAVIAASIARFQGDDVYRAFIAELEADAHAAESAAGILPARSSAESLPPGPATPHDAIAPGWFPDPSARHQLRYYDGTRWTEHVATNGVQSTDAPT
jgi:hypothetical protein